MCDRTKKMDHNIIVQCRLIVHSAHEISKTISVRHEMNDNPDIDKVLEGIKYHSMQAVYYSMISSTRLNVRRTSGFITNDLVRRQSTFVSRGASS
jgi:hypothetical protein